MLQISFFSFWQACSMRTNVPRPVWNSSFVPTIPILDLKTQWGEFYVNFTWTWCSDEWRWSRDEDIFVLQVHLLAPLLLRRHHHWLRRLSCWGSPLPGGESLINQFQNIILVVKRLPLLKILSWILMVFLYGSKLWVAINMVQKA